MIQSVGIQSPGDMGHALGAVLVEAGVRVLSVLAGRSTETRARAERAGIEGASDLDALIAESDIVLSVLPPSAAEAFGADTAAAMERTGSTPVFADCNAVSPMTAKRIADSVTVAGATFVDGSLIGAPPRPDGMPTRLYVSGSDSAALHQLAVDTERGAIEVHDLGDAIGAASAIKMVYAGLTKGTMTLHTAALLAAERYGLSEPFHAELQRSQGHAWKSMGRVPFLAADAERWTGEMAEIADAFGEAGLPTGFHKAAEQIFALLASTPFASETRETLDRSRTLQETLGELSSTIDRTR